MKVLPLAACLLLPLAVDPPASEEANDAAPVLSPEEAKAALAPLNAYVGEWRGVGQVRRGSRLGAWTETGEWLWDFSDPKAPAVTLEVNDGQHIDELIVRPAQDGEGFSATLVRPTKTPDEKPETAVLTAKTLGDAVEWAPVGDGSDRLTMRRLNEKRFTLLIERRSSPTGRFRRVAEVGYTRKGQRLAESSLGGPECVVSGGLGTIEVSHAGKTYYVCCTGCVAAFEADPEGTLADYKARKAAEAAKRAGAGSDGSASPPQQE